MAIEFTESAGKHGFTRDDATHAMLHATYQEEGFEASRNPGGPAPTLWLGPAVDGTEVEVMTWHRKPSTVMIFHCMPARQKFRDRATRRKQSYDEDRPPDPQDGEPAGGPSRG